MRRASGGCRRDAGPCAAANSGWAGADRATVLQAFPAPDILGTSQVHCLPTTYGPVARGLRDCTAGREIRAPPLPARAILLGVRRATAAQFDAAGSASGPTHAWAPFQMAKSGYHRRPDGEVSSAAGVQLEAVGDGLAADRQRPVASRAVHTGGRRELHSSASGVERGS
jgi:hypothetical protein